MHIEAVGYDHPDAMKLIAEVQQEYVLRYGNEDDSPVEPAQFAPPLGLFLVGYLDDVPVASGGWRVCGRTGDHTALRAGDVELKRMYVVPEARGRGLARTMLAELERTARVAGHDRMVLETGTGQPEAITLYVTSGYRPVAKFGTYKDSGSSVHLGKLLAQQEN